MKQLLVAFIVFTAVLLISSVAVYAYRTMNPDTSGPSYVHEEPSCGGIIYQGRCEPIADKPVIYLYPTRTENVKVKLQYAGTLTSTYPTYNNDIGGWDVTANPDSSLVNTADNKPYSYIFWEGVSDTDFSNFDTGFVVKGADTKDFLQTTLAKLGLTPKEYNEMIVYWLPKMEHNKYNLIHFAGQEYTDSAKLTVTPTPDSVLRIFMVFKPIEKEQTIQPQQLTTFERKGFAVVEWGGTELQ
jgi:hypothetical protein